MRSVPLLMGLACLAAGLYGMVHNQISFTVAPEYFTAFKFRQFGVLAGPPRLGASMVGFLASWWMGLLLGPPVILMGARFREQQWRETVLAFGVVAVTALVVGLGALGMAYAFPPLGWTPDTVLDPVAFRRAGTMHNFSYLGGFVGILTGCSFLAVRHHRRCSDVNGS